MPTILRYILDVTYENRTGPDPPNHVWLLFVTLRLQLLLCPLPQLPRQFRVLSELRLTAFLRDRRIVRSIPHLNHLTICFHLQPCPRLSFDWGGSSPSLIPGALTGWRCEELPKWVYQHSDKGMILFEGIKKFGCYTARVDCYRGDLGMTPSELGGKEDISQLRLAISCPG